LKKNIVSFLIGALAVFTPGRAALAQVYLSEGKVELVMAPGETVSGRLTVTNPSESEIRVKAYWEDFAYKPPYDGSKDFMPAGTLEDTMREFITFSPQTFILAPRGKRDINYVVKAPAGFTGGRHGVLFIEKDGQTEVTSAGVRIVTRIGSLFFMESVDKNMRVDVDGFEADSEALSMKVNNFGNTTVIPKGIYYLLGADGMVADRGEIPAVYLPRASAAAARMPLDKGLEAGRYTAVITFDMGRQYIVVREVDIEKTRPGIHEILAVRN
jgi:hypothetical protein